VQPCRCWGAFIPTFFATKRRKCECHFNDEEKSLKTLPQNALEKEENNAWTNGQSKRKQTLIRAYQLAAQGPLLLNFFASISKLECLSLESIFQPQLKAGCYPGGANFIVNFFWIVKFFGATPIGGFQA
jgi:hypothetical protein